MNSASDKNREHAELNRRHFLRAAASASVPMALLGTRSISAQEKAVEAPSTPALREGFIIREKSPPNLEMPFSSLNGVITSNDRHYVRCHFPIPKIDPNEWRLKIEGEVEKPISLSLQDLKELKPCSAPVTLECAGNGRIYLMQKSKSSLWELGAVGNARWTGVRLSDVLTKAGLKAGAVEVVLEGADEGEIEDPPRPAGKIHFARSVTITKALDDVMLAMEMNGQPLPENHGAPVRAIVPGWYGMASVKWLSRIVAVKEPFRGFFQTVQYATWERSDGKPPAQVPITEMQVKAEIARPDAGEVVPAGQTIRVHGAAWTADSEITKVEFSDDLGLTWAAATILGDQTKNAWRLWEHQWKAPSKPGRETLMVRATDAKGRQQPAKHDPDRGSYMINHCLPIEVEVR